MPSPQGIFVGLDRAALEALRDAAILRITQGDRVSLSGAAKSSGKNYSMSASEELREVQFALNKLLGTALPTATYFDAGRARG